MKSLLVRSADVLLRCALAGIAVVLIGTELLIFDVAVNRTAGVIAASGTVVVVAAAAILPGIVMAKSRRGRRHAT